MDIGGALKRHFCGEDRLPRLKARNPQRFEAFYRYGWEKARRDQGGENHELTIFPAGVGTGLKGLGHATLALEEGWGQSEIDKVVEQGESDFPQYLVNEI